MVMTKSDVEHAVPSDKDVEKRRIEELKIPTLERTDVAPVAVAPNETEGFTVTRKPSPTVEEYAAEHPENAPTFEREKAEDEETAPAAKKAVAKKTTAKKTVAKKATAQK